MKKFTALALVTLGITVSARAQWIVFDPTMNVQSIINTAQEIAKYVEMINNQVQQIQTLTDQLNEFKHYEDLFGDPKAVLLTTVQPLVNDLRKTKLARPDRARRRSGCRRRHALQRQRPVHEHRHDVQHAERRNGYGAKRRIYRSRRSSENDGQLSVRLSRRDRTPRALKGNRPHHHLALKSATTDAEVQKLTGVLIGLSSALNNTDYEINQATASALVQDVANRNDAQRQIEAKKEQQHAEFTEAVQKYGQTFRLMNAPTAFPTP
ncbi:MAG: DUF4141 domain-containing protein [Verrucomicrobiota bacterium]